MRVARLLAICLGILAAQAGAAADPALKTRKDKVSYAMAVAMARTVQRQGVDIDVAVFTRGMYDVLQGGKLLMTQDEMKEVMAGVVSDLKERKELKERQEKEKQERAGAKKKAKSAAR